MSGKESFKILFSDTKIVYIDYEFIKINSNNIGSNYGDF